MAISKFRRGSSTFHCNVCERLTRDTGAQGFDNRICPQCFELAGLENEISDGYSTLDENRANVVRLVGEIEAKGGDIADWQATFTL